MQRLIYGIIGLVLILAPCYAQEMNRQRPNIVLILADDLGYGSVNAYGADTTLVRTPNIDRLAKEGMRFTDASTPVSLCTPTRYGLLTGRYSWRTSLKYGVLGVHDPLLIDTARTTLADWLQLRGYRSAAIGKWHLGYTKDDRADFTGPLTPGPLQIGFNYHFGVPQNHGDYTGVYVENEYVYGLQSKKVQPYSRTFYGSRYMGLDAPQRTNKEVNNELTEKAIQWLKGQDQDTPFFLFFEPVAVHHPITPSDNMRGLSDAGPYGDFIQDLDQSVGQIMETLRYMGLLENTLVLFTSDNGGQIPSEADPGPLPDFEASPEIQAVKAGLKINGSFRGDKHTIWEGGTRVPFIVAWPGMVEEGTVTSEMISLLDVFATVAEITEGNVPPPDGAAPDSYSFLPVLTQSGPTQRTSMVTADANGMQAIRKGDWKYIDNTFPATLPERRRKQMKDFQPQLYNLAEDSSESSNLYNSKPDVVAELLEALEQIRKE